MDEKFLVGFSISPVQKFIVAARTTQDLYNASRFLSYIGEKIVNKLNEYNADVIFPKFSNDMPVKYSSVPNMVLSVVRGSKSEVEKKLKEIKSDVENEINRIGIDVLKEVYKNPTEFAEKLVIRQLASYFTINYAAVPMKGDYKSAYENLSKVMGAYKITRVFKQVAEEGIKCSLCGENEVVHNKKFSGTIIDMRKELAELKSKHSYLFQKNEALCGVDLLKRGVHLVREKNFECSFPSTARVLTLHISNDKAYTEVKNKMKDILKSIIGDAFDDQLLFMENLTESYFRKNLNVEKINRESIKEIIKKLVPLAKNLKEELKKQKKKIPRYYAVLMLDGDLMGEWMNGASAKDTSSLKECQESISEALSDFNKKVRDFFDNHKEYGKLIYAGGDDVLAFVNINHLFEMLKKLHKTYPKEFSGCKNKKAPTCSVGVCVAHYKEPLTLVLRKAREMENKAKEYGGRNTFAIAVINKSGSINEFVSSESKWEGLDKVNDLVAKMKNDVISNKFIYTFLEETKLLNYTDEVKSKSQRDVDLYEEEFYRLLKRSIKDDKNRSALFKELRGAGYYESFKEDIANALIIVASLAKIINPNVGYKEGKR